MRSERYLNEIREAEGLKRAVLQKIVVDGKTAEFFLLTDLTYSAEDVAHADSVSARYAPAGFAGKARITKSVPSAEGVRRALAQTLKTRFPAAAAFVSLEDIQAETEVGGGRFSICAEESERARLAGDHVLDALQSEISRQFCGVWRGEFRMVKKEKGEIEFEPEPEETVLAPRFFPVCEYSPIDGMEPKRAIYIADLNGEMQGVTVCGTVSFIEERETKNKKPYFSITISDGSGQLRASYFTRKATLEKVRTVAQGASVCLSGDNELFNGSLSFRIKGIDFGSPPQGFVPEQRPSLPVPAVYKKVVPAPVSDLVQGGMFDGSPLPEEFKRGKFVVFDLETTGLSKGGIMDRIIEVGGVKIENGSICEKFSTFVACPVKLSEEIIGLTGITDDMLAGAPEIKDVIADFYKFCYGSVLVAHNASFDCKFIRYYGEKEGYIFDMRQIDTVAFAQETLRLSNYKLNTVADHFGFTFNHHRAFDDAFVTAKIFTELVKIKGGLPRF
ncbi:MAG: hypothetical protein HFE26_02260 [Clostridia bacterium]|nr:hypothetical protein [Clostridia bacterium]